MLYYINLCHKNIIGWIIKIIDKYFAKILIFAHHLFTKIKKVKMN